MEVKNRSVVSTFDQLAVFLYSQRIQAYFQYKSLVGPKHLVTHRAVAVISVQPPTPSL